MITIVGLPDGLPAAVDGAADAGAEADAGAAEGARDAADGDGVAELPHAEARSASAAAPAATRREYWYIEICLLYE